MEVPIATLPPQANLPPVTSAFVPATACGELGAPGLLVPKPAAPERELLLVPSPLPPLEPEPLVTLPTAPNPSCATPKLVQSTVLGAHGALGASVTRSAAPERKLPLVPLSLKVLMEVSSVTPLMEAVSKIVTLRLVLSNHPSIACGPCGAHGPRALRLAELELLNVLVPSLRKPAMVERTAILPKELNLPLVTPKFAPSTARGARGARGARATRLAALESERPQELSSLLRKAPERPVTLTTEPSLKLATPNLATAFGVLGPHGVNAVRLAVLDHV